MLRVKVIRGTGNKRAISMSKTRKIKASRKKRRENGMRAVFLGSNPHSKGEAVSRFRADRLDKIKAEISVMPLIAIAAAVAYSRVFM